MKELKIKDINIDSFYTNKHAGAAGENSTVTTIKIRVTDVDLNELNKILASPSVDMILKDKSVEIQQVIWRGTR